VLLLPLVPPKALLLHLKLLKKRSLKRRKKRLWKVLWIYSEEMMTGNKLLSVS